jgi:S-DNA-T family DNA segregation ATPase FtsK/SpoIIIE
MRREIIGIFLFFFVIFTLISLLSYSPADPSIHSAGTGARVQNLFGVVRAGLAGLIDRTLSGWGFLGSRPVC